MVFKIVMCVFGMLLLSACVTTSGPRPPSAYGQLTMPEGPGPFPAVILLHGARGVGRPESMWSQRFVRAGYVTLVVDSGPSARDALYAAARQRARELVGAVSSLRTLSTVKGHSIAVLGRSHGAWAALIALAKSYTKLPDTSPRAIVAFFPSCGPGDDYWRGWEVKAPVLLLLGETDTVTPPQGCERLAARLAEQGQPVRAITYPKVGHQFDMGVGLAAQQSEEEVIRFFAQHLRSQ